MERSAPASTSKTFVSWEEVFVSPDKGRREVRYYLKRPDGKSDLVVIGKEASLRHMSYRYALRDKSLLYVLPSLLKLRSRRDVVDWLNSIVPDSPLDQSQQLGGSLGCKNVCELKVGKEKDVQVSKPGQYTNFLWLGSPWTCRKRRRHYQSFDRNGVQISVNDFVYVLAEEDKQLVAYLDDMYEDSRGNKMVVVRWFHKIDEVGIILPQSYNDREIFFSLCLQDLSIECVDGLATVLCPQHYEKYLNEAAQSQLEPFICHRQFDNDDMEPFDVTQLKGYWKQEQIRYMFNTSPSRTLARSQLPCYSLRVEGNLSDAFNTRPRKRLRRFKDREQDFHSGSTLESEDLCLDKKRIGENSIGFALPNSSGLKNETELGNAKDVFTASSLTGKEVIAQKPHELISLGSQVEVLSQDSGIRGCWFRALIIKKRKDKVKVQYRDLKDAADEAKNLEEWILASRVAIDDELGVRIRGRPTIRPARVSNKGKVSWVVNVGTIVDVWWHDGWWEGIVVQKENDDKFHVYFPGEKLEAVIGLSELRHSQEWLKNGWKHIKERLDVVTSISCGPKTKKSTINLCDGPKTKKSTTNLCDGNEMQVATCDKKPNGIIVHKDSLSSKDEVGSSNSESDRVDDDIRDLSKDELLSQLKWKSSRKRRRPSNSAQKVVHYSSTEASSMQSGEHFLFPTTSLKVDSDNCKYIRESLFSSSVVPTLTSLVMSR